MNVNGIVTLHYINIQSSNRDFTPSAHYADNTRTRTKARPPALVWHKGAAARSTRSAARRRTRTESGRGSVRPAYLHTLDGLISVPHRPDLLVHGLVRQQQLVEDLQRPGPVPDRFQRHDPYEMRLKISCGGLRSFGRRPVGSGCVENGAQRCGRSLKASADRMKREHGTACSLRQEAPPM